MDLSLIQELLETFETFGKNIGTAIQGIPGLLGDIWGFITGFEENAELTSSNLEDLSSVADNEPAADEADGSSLPGSSVDNGDADNGDADLEAEAASSIPGSSAEVQAEAGTE